MIRGVEAILLSSERPRKLADFYKNIVGLKVTMEFELGEKNEEGFAFEKIGGCNIYILHHSKVKGKNTHPERVIFNLEVDDIKKEFTRIKKAGAKVVQETYHVEEYGQIATFEDPDGNYFQIVQVREKAN